MERKPRSSFLKLLSEPSFDFTPYFDKAVIEWLERNMGSFLSERPEASAFFLKEDDCRHMVAEHLPLTDDKQIANFLKDFDNGWHSESALTTIAPRLVEAGKADLIVHAATTLSNMGSVNVEKIIESLSAEAVRTLYDQIDFGRTRWTSNARCAFLKKLPIDLLIQVEPRGWSWYDAETAPNAISTLATRWPIEDINNFLMKYGEVYPALFCMHCGAKTAKSKPGYTLHRKTCDPQNQHPNIWTSIAERTM